MIFFTKAKYFCFMGILLVLFTEVNAQTDLTPGYDIGVFYMPFWHSNDIDQVNTPQRPDPYTHPNQTQHHWSLIDQYDRWLVNSKGALDRVRAPSAIYYQHGSGVAYGPAAWYNENLKGVTEKQLQLMSQYGIDFVIYDSFWDLRPWGEYKPLWQGVIDNWLPNNGPQNTSDPNWDNITDPWDPRSTPLNNHGVEMALMWTEDHQNKIISNGCDPFFKSGGGLDKMVDYWAQYMKLDDYKTVENGRPLFYVYNATVIADMVSDCKNHAFFNGAAPQIPNTTWIPFTRVKHLMEYMNARFKSKANLSSDVYFVAVVGMDAATYSWAEKWDWLKRFPDEGGFDASTTLKYEVWNYTDHIDFSKSPGYKGFNYNRMSNIAQQYHNYVLNSSGYSNTNVDYFVPVSAGFDPSPHHYEQRNNPDYPDPNHPNPGNPNYFYKNSASDYRISTPTSFGQALNTAKGHTDQHPTRTKKIVNIYAWNEHSEGTVISPTRRWGYQYLQKILDVFGTGSRSSANLSNEVSIEGIAENTIKIITYISDPSLVELDLNLMRGSDLEIQVVDLQGKVLQQEIFKNQPEGKSKAQFNLNFEAQGIYIIRASALGINKAKKIILN